ncbi:MAG: hypothetical protein MUC42_08360, partial [Bryobacter sp.]|nr:hypothetical protein [Bryobacter sp.]
TGMFETIGFKFEPSADRKGYDATFEVVEITPLLPFQFEELPVEASKIIAHLKSVDPLYGGRIPATKPMLERYSGLIESFLAAQGKPEKVVGRVQADQPEKLYVLFRPAKLPPAVVQVAFQGNDVLPSGMLQQAMNAVATGLVYKEDRFRELLKTQVVPLYEARGRIRVQFPKITATPAAEINGVNVTVMVVEGDSYNLGAVRVTGANEREMLKVAGLKPGSLADFDRINAGIEEMRRALRRQGFLEVSATPERKHDDAKKVVDLDVVIVAGRQYAMGKLTIEGLDIQTEPYIRKLWTLAEGKPYNAEYPDFFLKEIREKQLMDDLGETKSIPTVDEARRTVDVKLIFKAAPVPQKKKRF